MKRPIQSKQGISLIVVLSIMLAATVMATAVYYTISRYNKRSGEDLYSASAVAAAKAGAASVQSWLTYNGQQTLSLVNAFLDTTQNPGRQGIQLSLSSDLTATANATGQSYKVYLVDVVADSNATVKNVSLKFQIVAMGQDGATSIATVMYKLDGIGYQVPQPVITSGVGSMPIKDAIYVGGTFTGSQNVTTQGSAYFNSTTNLNVGSMVTENLVIGPGSSCISISGGSASGTTVKGNFYSATPLNLNSTTTIFGNAYMAAGICGSGSFPITFKQDAYFGGSVLNVDQGSDTLLIKGNAYFEDSLEWHGSIVQIDGDAGFGPNSHIWDKDANSRPNFIVNGNMNAYGDMVIGTGSTSPATVSFGGTAVNWAHIKYISPAVDSAKISWGALTHKIGDPSLWGIDTSLNKLNTLDTIRAQLNASGTKMIPIQMDSTQINAKKLVFSSLLTLYNTCETGSHTSPYVDELECIFGKVPDSQKLNGYLVIDLQSAGITFLNGTGNPASLTQKYVFVNPGTLANIQITPTTTNARVVFYYQTPGNWSINPVSSTADTCYCMWYMASGVTISTQGSSPMVVQGAVVAAAGSTFNSTLGYTFIHNNTVLTDLASGGFIDDSSGHNLASGISKTNTAQSTLSLLSPRLNVSIANMIFGPTNASLSSIVWGNFMVVDPTIVSVTQNDYSNWTAFSNSIIFHAYVKPDSSGCVITPNYNAVHFDQPGSWPVVFSASGCTHGVSPSGSMLIWVKPLNASATSATSISSSNITYSGSLSSSVTSSSSSVTSVSSSSLAGFPIPGHIEAEAYTSMYGVSTESTSDVGGGLDVGWIDPGDSTVYPITVAMTGSYTFTFRLASWSTGGTIQIKQGSTVVGSVTVPVTGWWQTWQTVTASAPIVLTAGYSSLTLKFTAGNFNVNYFDASYYVSSSSSTPVSSSSSAKANTPPYGGACNVDYNARTVGQVTAVTIPTAWSDSTYPGTNVVQYTFDNGSTWTSSASNTWAATTGSPFTIKMRATDPNGAVSALVTCAGGNPVTVTAASSSSSAACASGQCSSSPYPVTFGNNVTLSYSPMYWGLTLGSGSLHLQMNNTGCAFSVQVNCWNGSSWVAASPASASSAWYQEFVCSSGTTNLQVTNTSGGSCNSVKPAGGFW